MRVYAKDERTAETHQQHVCHPEIFGMKQLIVLTLMTAVTFKSSKPLSVGVDCNI